MTLFLNAHTDRLAPGSFQQPVPIPASLPGSPDFVTVCFNKDWLPYVLGSLFQLTLNTTWQASSQTELMNALQMANDLILIFQLAKPGCQDANPGFAGAGEDYMLRQNPDNPCELQSSVDGVTWCTWADISKCTVGTQPGAGAPQPKSGGCQTYHGAITPINSWVLPTPVSSGDTITVSNLIGSWSPSQFTDIWECPDGNLFFNGICIDGTGGTDAGAPDPTANLNSTLLYDGTHYYDVGAASNPATPVTVTIGPGVSNAQLIVRCNFHGGVDPAGSVDFDIQACNNTPAPWSHTLNFAVGKQGFVAHTYTPCGDLGAAWVAATGWEQVNTGACIDSSPRFTEDYIQNAFGSATTLTSITATYNATLGTDSGGSGLNVDILSFLSGVQTVLKSQATASGTNQTITWSGSQSADTLGLLISSSDAGSGGTGNGASVWLTLTISGTGPDPFSGM